MLFNDGLVLITTMMSENTADHDALTSQLVGYVSRLRLREFHLQTIPPQSLHNLEVRGIMEITDDTLGHHLTNPLNLLQFLKSRMHQGIDIFEMTGQQLRRCLSYKSDTQGKDHALKRHLLRGGNAIHDPLGRLRPTAITIDLLHVDVIQIGNVMDESLTIVVIDGLRAQ